MTIRHMIQDKNSDSLLCVCKECHRTAEYDGEACRIWHYPRCPHFRDCKCLACKEPVTEPATIGGEKVDTRPYCAECYAEVRLGQTPKVTDGDAGAAPNMVYRQRVKKGKTGGG